MGRVDHLDGERLGPGVTGEPAPEDGAVVLPPVAGISGGMDPEDAQVAAAPRFGDGRLLGRGERRLPDGEQGQDAAGLELADGQFADPGHRHRLQPGHGPQLGQGGSRLAEHPVDPRRSLAVWGHVGDDQEGRSARARSRFGQSHQPGSSMTLRARRTDWSTYSGPRSPEVQAITLVTHTISITSATLSWVGEGGPPAMA